MLLLQKQPTWNSHVQVCWRKNLTSRQKNSAKQSACCPCQMTLQKELHSGGRYRVLGRHPRCAERLSTLLQNSLYPARKAVSNTVLLAEKLRLAAVESCSAC